ncbi:MAG: hypothetical protein GQ557_02110, partial [Mycoplasmataceae bacterium]|nr:hypothetical protein [Mycoplasmataceae bacterium]
MPTVNLIKGYFDLNAEFVKAENEKLSRATSNASQLQIITPIDTAYVSDVTFLLNSGRTVEYQTLRFEGTESVEVSANVFETWNVYAYDVPTNVVSTVSLLTSSPLYYSARFREIDPLFYGIVSDYTDLPTLAEDSTLVDENFATTGTTTLTTYEYDADADEWNDLGYEKSPYTQILQTTQRQLTVFPTVLGSETNISASEVDIIRQWLTDLETDIETINESLKQQTDGAFEPLNDDVWSSDLRMATYLKGAYRTLGLDYTFGDTTHDKIIIGDKEITNNVTNNTLNVKLNDNVTGEMFQLENRYMYNNTGSNITDTQIVYVSGASGQKETIALAINSDKSKAHNTIGVTTESIDNLSSGFVTLSGVVENVNTTGDFTGVGGIDENWQDGDKLYIGSVAGRPTNIKPVAPLFNVEVAICVNSGSVGAGIIDVLLDKVHQIEEAPDVKLTSIVSGDLLVRNSTNEYFENKNIDTITFDKTGWPVDVMTDVDIAFAFPTFTLTINNEPDTYQENVKYTMAVGTYTVDITATEGNWYFTLNEGVLEASQTVWDLRLNNRVLVAEGYYDAVNSEMELAYEFHSYEMSGVDHFNGHFGTKTRVVNGLAVSDNGSDGLDVTQGTMMDEDIVIQILDNDTPTAKFEQPLTPLKSHKYYFEGASGLLRKVNDSIIPVYLVANKIQLNPFITGAYSLVDMNNNKFGAYWIVDTTTVSNPVKIFLGQTESDSLDNAIADNGLGSMNFNSIPLAEIRVAYR